jgi:hypothetical protein
MTLAVVRVWCYTCGMKIISKIACTVLALGVTACSKEPTGETSYKGDFKVSKLFVQDACTGIAELLAAFSHLVKYTN